MLKKVELGITEFDELMENHRHASQPNQRAKYEENMKTSIKKLQRDRCQLSTWISDNGVKEKSALTDARSKIEARMMTFKTLERDVLKAFNDENQAVEEFQPRGCVED
ncbi:not3 [Symbiodinium natans]|uniref:Not3 protein n=1 Tax=Symbiodinium natans TaxID=878477 RepID=A0A812QAK0_9DINO|nr:not3 [Symbiodinium natans]